MLATCLVLVLTGQADLPYHRWEETTPQILRAIREQTSCETRVVEDISALTPATLTKYQALVVNYNGPRLSRVQEEAIENFVRNGGGLVAFHHALYGEWFGHRFGAKNRWEATSDPGWFEWPRILGASWNPEVLGHARRGAFEVKCEPGPVCEGESFTVTDELYHRFTLARTAKPAASAMSFKEVGGTGAVEPIAWTNSYGKGRVFFTTLGHDNTALFGHGTQKLFARGIAWAAGAPPRQPAAKPVRVLAVTGGHGYPEAFYSLWNEMPGIEWRHAQSQADMVRRKHDQFDVLVLHDMYDQTSQATRDWLKAWVESGKGVISLHHAIVDYTDWPWWWQEVIGGKYFVQPLEGHAKSSYKEDIAFNVTPSPGKQKHPVLEGVVPLVVEDEMYKDMWQSPKIEVLMETANPLNDKPVVYTGPCTTARTLYVQLGHSAETFHNPGFRRLMKNAVEWTARRR